MKLQINELTKTPGGSTVLILFTDGRWVRRQRVKYPNSYIKKIVEISKFDNVKIEEVYVDNKLFNRWSKIPRPDMEL